MLYEEKQIWIYVGDSLVLKQFRGSVLKASFQTKK